ncbi:TetR/AcrR family transcriptional regulator [Salinisphaera sp. T31B1]|uniref:TetR/AcrR family transcriptional regulator n=1 Tax=Salinisphaera sp. T31B1 TaxID=727963 RepID=UPI003342C223
MTEMAPDTAQAAFVRAHGLDTPSLCRRIVAAREGQISVRSPDVAADNLARIIESTLRLANRKGFAAMTLRELARASGLSLGGLYAYIGNKDELARLIQRRIALTLGETMQTALADLDDPRERLARAIQAHLMITEALREWFFFLYMEAHHLAADERREAVAMERASEDIFSDIIRAGQQAGVYGDCDAAVAAGLIKAMLQDWYLKHGKHRERGLTLTRYAALITHTIEPALARPLATENDS